MKCAEKFESYCSSVNNKTSEDSNLNSYGEAVEAVGRLVKEIRTGRGDIQLRALKKELEAL
jgi:hypothetical protein